MPKCWCHLRCGGDKLVHRATYKIHETFRDYDAAHPNWWQSEDGLQNALTELGLEGGFRLGVAAQTVRTNSCLLLSCLIVLPCRTIIVLQILQTIDQSIHHPLLVWEQRRIQSNHTLQHQDTPVLLPSLVPLLTLVLVLVLVPVLVLVLTLALALNLTLLDLVLLLDPV
jgi:hypothetical protein